MARRLLILFILLAQVSSIDRVSAVSRPTEAFCNTQALAESLLSFRQWKTAARQGRVPLISRLLYPPVRAHLNERPIIHWRLKLHLLRKLLTYHPEHYGEMGKHRLREALAAHLVVPETQVVEYAGGSMALIAPILHATKIFSSDKIPFLPLPNFKGFNYYFKLNHLEPSLFQLADNNNFLLTPMNVEKKILEDPTTRLVVLTNPHNPTGAMFDPEEFRETIVRHPDVFFLFDEAYAEFVTQNALSLVREYPNVMITRTFSKAYGLAGERVGYLIASEAIIAAVKKDMSLRPLSELQEAAALFVLNHQSFMKRAVSRVLRWHAQLAGDLAQVPGITVHPSLVHFSLIQIDSWGSGSAQALKDFLHAERIYVDAQHQQDGLIGREFLRITTSTPRNNRRLVDAILRFRKLQIAA